MGAIISSLVCEHDVLSLSNELLIGHASKSLCDLLADGLIGLAISSISTEIYLRFVNICWKQILMQEILDSYPNFFQ